MAYALLWSAGRSLETFTSVPSPALTRSFSQSLKYPHRTPKRQRVISSCSHFPDSEFCAASTLVFREDVPSGAQPSRNTSAHRHVPHMDRYIKPHLICLPDPHPMGDLSPLSLS